MGLICGILGSFSCEFYSNYSTGYGGDIRDALDSVGLSDLADVGQVQFGIFGYEGRNDQCIDYPIGTFNDQEDRDFWLVQTSQINAAVSIAFGILGILLTLMELIICNFIGSCTFAMFSFFVAWATMAGAIGTFITGVVESGFWYVLLLLF